MARCLKGESTQEDNLMLNDLLLSDPEMKAQFDHFSSLMKHDCNSPLNDVLQEAYLQEKFDRITSSLRDEGSL